MSFTAKDVKELREVTGVGMMDCKKALVETNGDMEKAIAYLREQGLATAQKKAGRIAAEGAAYATVIDGVGAVVEVNAETDFVAKNDKFVSFVEGVAEAVIKNNPADLDALMASNYPGSSRTVAEEQQEMIVVIGENIAVRRFERYTEGFNVPYIHAGGKIGVLVSLEVNNISDEAALTELGKDLAMQIAAMRPMYLNSDSVDASEIEKEREIQLNKAIEENKAKNLPEDKAVKIAENMVKGRMNKFFEDICLVNQPFVKGDKISVEAHINQVAKSLGGDIKISSFARFEKGEGIEKKEDDFAAEVASMVK